jgi:hypothetical protein
MTSVDNETASLTLTNVVETVTPTPVGHPSAMAGLQTFIGARVLATWAKTDDDDNDQQFECRVSGRKPDGNLLFESPWLAVQFPKHIYFHRVVIGLPNFGRFDQDGLHIIRAELRRGDVERPEWSQEAPFRVISAHPDIPADEVAQ